MQTIYPMMPKALGAEPKPTLGPLGTLFCAAVVLVLVLAGTLGQADEAPQELACTPDVLVIPAEGQQAKPCIGCGGSHVIGEDGSIPCGF